MLRLVVDQLARLFGPSAENVTAFLYKDWSSDLDTAVGKDAEPLRDYPSYGPLGSAANWGKKIIFAGTETADEQGGHLEGALQSTERAASELMELYKTHR